MPNIARPLARRWQCRSPLEHLQADAALGVIRCSIDRPEPIQSVDCQKVVPSESLQHQIPLRPRGFAPPAWST
jgi:hypothetical protein